MKLTQIKYAITAAASYRSSHTATASLQSDCMGRSRDSDCSAAPQVKAVRVDGSQLTQQGDILVIIEPSEE